MRKITVIAICILSFSVQNAFSLGSGGIGNEVVTAKSLALSGAILTEMDPGNVYLNPALLGDQGRMNSTLGLSYYNYSAQRKANGQTEKMDTLKTVVPSFFLSHSLGKIGLGIGVLSPYGLETDWSDSSAVRYVATKSKIKMYDVTSAISYRFNEALALGLGLDYFSTFDASLQKKAPVDVINFLLGFPTAGSADANSKLEGDGTQWGYHSSLAYSPTENHSFAVAYHSEVKTKIEGTLELDGLSGASANVFGGSKFTTEARTDLFYPQNIQVGYRFNPTEKTGIHFTTAWYDWSANKQLELVLPNATAVQKSIVGSPVPLNWRDVWSFAISANHLINQKWEIGYGTFFESAIYPESTFSPAVPDLDRYGASVGIFFQNNLFKFQSVYEPIFLKKQTIQNNLGQATAGLPSADISGEYGGFVHVLGINIGVQF